MYLFNVVLTVRPYEQFKWLSYRDTKDRILL